MNKIYLSALVFLPALFSACNMTDPEPTGSGAKAIVHVSIDNGTQERTVRPSLQSWELWGAVQGEDETLLAEFSSAGVTITLETGVWDFTLKGYGGEVLLLTGSIAEKTITEGTNTLAFTVALVASVEGEGAIALTVELPVGSGITEARVFKDEELYTSLEPIENRIVFEEAIHSGSYYFSIRLYKDEALYGVVSEMVIVWANMRSEKTYTLTTTDLNLTYTITYHFEDGETETDYYQYTDANKTLPTPSYPDRVFMGWCENADLSGNTVFTIPSGSTTGDKDFYPWWTEMVDTPSDLSLAESLAWIKSQTQGGAYTITLKADEALAPTSLSRGVSSVSITIEGGTTERTISLDSTGSLFSVGSGVTLTLGNNVTLQGRSDNTDSLVRVSSGGTLVMNAGAKISGNTTTSSGSAYGGGVYVYSGGTFTMNGGEISGNTASGSGNNTSGSGGGVYNSGIFTMNGGEITGNTAASTSSSASGGGVYSYGTFEMSGGAISGNTASGSSASGGGVDNGGTFEMSGGEISGNTASAASTSSSPAFASGGGVYSYGTFEMSSGEISGNTASASSTSSSPAYAYGGGVYVVSYGTFTKQSDGNIYGLNAPVSLRNTATNGHAVYVSSGKLRNTTADVGVSLDSTVDGADGGWETTWNSIQIDFASDPGLSNNVSLLVNQSYGFNAGTNYASWTWYWNGELISGATSSSYILTADKSETPGIYELSVVVVTNTGGRLSAQCRVVVKAK